MNRKNICSDILPQPVAAFSRASKITFNDIECIFISGTASVNEKRESVHIDDFKSQVYKTYENIESLLVEADAAFSDIVSMTVYLKDMKFYKTFNTIRDSFFKRKKLVYVPTSTCVEATLCRPELLVEISAIALKQKIGV